MNITSSKEINRLAIPAVLTELSEPIISMTDTALVGRLDHYSIAGVGLGTSFFLLLVWLLYSFCHAVTSMCANYYGAKNIDKANLIASQALVIIFFLGIVFYFVSNLFIGPIFGLYNAEGEILAKSIEYYRIRSLGLPLILSSYVLFSVFKGFQNTSRAMFIVLTTAGLNIILDLLLIHGVKEMIPAMGVKGAALASLISQICMVVMAVASIKKSPFRFKNIFQKNKELKRLLTMSFDLLIRAISLNGALFFANRIATSHGTYTIAAHTIFINIWLFTAFFIDGYASAGVAISGKLVGEKGYRMLVHLSRRICFINIIISIIVAIILFVFRPYILGLFTNDAQVIEAGATAYYFLLIAILIGGVAFTYDGLFIGIGNVAYLRNILLIATFIAFLPTVYLLSYFGIKLSGIWIGFCMWLIVRSLLPHFKFRKLFNENDNKYCQSTGH